MTADKGFKRLVRERSRQTGESYAAARRALLSKQREAPMTAPPDEGARDLIDVTIDGVWLGTGGPQTCFVELKETGGSRRLPIFIGPQEGSAIVFALEGRLTPRPMTHDALKQVIDAAGGRVVSVVVGHRSDTSTFTADVTFAVDAGEQHLDWRASDAIALAVRCDPRPPILVPSTLLQDSSSPPRRVMAWLGRVQLRCSCGEVVEVAPPALRITAPSPDHFEGSFDCPACGRSQTVSLDPPSVFNRR